MFNSPEPGVDAKSAKDRIDAGAAFILDVREPEEWLAGHIDGAVNIPLGALDARRNEVPRDRHIIAVCRSGHRSGIASSVLQREGYDIENLLGGMYAWDDAGFPMQPRQGRVI